MAIKSVTTPFSLMVSETLKGKQIEYEGAWRTIVEANVHHRVGTIGIETSDGLAFNISLEEKYHFKLDTAIRKVKPRNRRHRGK